MIQVLDQGYIKIIETWGSDERIIEAARMSTDKGFLGWGNIEKPGDEKLLSYLYNNKHMTPFEMGGAIIEVQAPIFVFREWHRHRTQSYNELSARYTALPDMFYVPSIERLEFAKQAQKNKQGSELWDENATPKIVDLILQESYRLSRAHYDQLLQLGVAKEIARLVIPVAQYSRMRASTNLRNWLQFLTLRQAENAQWEIRQYANELNNLLIGVFPRTMELFNA